MLMEEIDTAKYVMNTVNHLNELSERLKTAGFQFRNDDIDHMDSIIQSLQDLDMDRIRSMEAYETETIKVSALRHKLMHYPGEINREISDAVKAARGLNEDTINRLQEQLDRILAHIQEMEALFEKFEKENALLIPQRDAIKLEHEEVIAELNHRLSQKAGKQIDLNETRDNVRGCNKRIVDLEEDVVQLKEDLIQERAAAREEKKRLNKETTETIEKYTAQHGQNAERKKNLEDLLHDVAEVELKLEDLRKTIRAHETMIEELQEKEREMTEQLDNQNEENERLRMEGLQIEEKDKDITEAFKEVRASLEKKIQDVEMNVKRQQKKQEVLKEKKEEMTTEVQHALKHREEDGKKVKELNDMLQNAKLELAMKAEDVGRLQQEIVDMEERIINVGETHKSTVAMLNKQIAELRDQLSRERQERIEMQQDKDTLQKEIDAFRSAHGKFIRENNKKINTGKEEHGKLTKEQQELQRSIKSDIDTAERLTKEIATGKVNLAEMKETLGDRISGLNSDIAQMEEQTAEKQAEIDARMPDFLEFESFFNRHMADYEVLKKKLVKMKNRKQGLEEAITRTNRDVNKQKNPIEELRRELTRRQEQSKEQLKKQGDEKLEIEREIYVTGCKLKTAVEENTRFEKGITDLESSITRMKHEWENALTIKNEMLSHVNLHKGILSTGWKEDTKLADEAEVKDLELLELLNGLLTRTGDREHLISGVTHRLQDELEGLTEFLENVGSRRRPGKGGRGGTETGKLARYARNIRLGMDVIQRVAHANQKGLR